MSVKESC